MRWQFRQDVRNEAARPSETELWLRPAEAARRGRRELSLDVCKRGLRALDTGSGETACLVLDADPTFDEMLAASLAERLLAGDEVPAGARAFAHYAKTIREGLRPSEIPLEHAIEGIYLALRNAEGGALEGAAAEDFVESWREMGNALWEAAERGDDPLTARLFDGPEFMTARTFLKSDRKAYRNDVATGKRFAVSIPDGPADASALLLWQPKSLLWKYWSREDVQAPGGAGYTLLGVSLRAGNWTFSTDPIERLSLAGLAARLQERERAVTVAAEADPWFDGQAFKHTLIAAPRRGSALSDDAVLAELSVWAAARALPPISASAPSVRPMTGPPSPAQERLPVAATLLATDAPRRLAGRYELVRKLGAGGMGAVYEARHVELQTRCAIKLLLPSSLRDPETLARFKQEAQIGARLSDPNIVKVFDFAQSDEGTPFLVMEFLDGEGLDEYLSREGPIALESFLPLFTELCGALDRTHRHGVVHRDLKPANIYLARFGGRQRCPKILDFGISKLTDSAHGLTQEGRLYGTYYYMSPEQAEGKNAAIDGRADVYSLAAILYHALAGEPPFLAPHPSAILYKIVHEPAKPLASRVGGLPEAVSAAVQRGLAKKPWDRPASAGAFAALLHEALGERSETALPSTVVGREAPKQEPQQEPSSTIPATRSGDDVE